MSRALIAASLSVMATVDSRWGDGRKASVVHNHVAIQQSPLVPEHRDVVFPARDGVNAMAAEVAGRPPPQVAPMSDREGARRLRRPRSARGTGRVGHRAGWW